MAKQTVISKEKKDLYIKACEDLDPIKVIPAKILQAERLEKMLKSDEIEADMLYKCGCPCDWVADAAIKCDTKKRKPKYSNECSYCWVTNLTCRGSNSNEVGFANITEEYENNEISKQELLTKLNEFEKFKLTPNQLDRVLSILGWKQSYDFNTFMEHINQLIETK